MGVKTEAGLWTTGSRPVVAVTIVAMVGTGDSAVRAWTAWWSSHAENEDPVVSAAARQGFVLGAAQLRDLDVGRSQTRTRVRRGTWSAPAVGVVAPLSVDDGDMRHVVQRRQHALLTAAGTLRNPSFVPFARSAAVLHGLPIMKVPSAAELLSPATRWPGDPAMSHRYQPALRAYMIDSWHGVAVTSVARTVVDLARRDRWDGLMAADAALRENLMTREALWDAVAWASGWPGVIQAREVLALADGRAESPLESISRLRMHDARLPMPQLQFEIGGYRTDFCWPERRLVLEADGLEKYSGDALHAEKRRERHLRRYGYRVERVTWDDITRQWPATLSWLTAALAG